jgi:hypothetical protein
MNLREAAQRALLALEFAYGFDIPHLDEHLDALDDLRTALAEPEQEPVAWMYEDELPSGYPYDLMFQHSKMDGVRLFPVFGPFPQRKPLTDEEIWKIYDETPSGKEQPFIIRFVRSVLAAHGIGEKV